MTIDENIRDEKLLYNIIYEAAKYQHYDQTKLIIMNILQGNKYYLLTKVE